MTQSIAPTGFICNIAPIKTDDEPIDVGAQFQIDDDGTEHRLILIGNNGGIYLEDLPALLEALAAAQAALQAPFKKAA
ncbi:hypothetical protein GS473_04535 [Rhodococcus hoagii]|nr:hypothetical protein [Prescottella equi]